MQKARAGQSVDDETLAKYTAAKGFLVAEAIGAILMVYSFTHLYVFGLRPQANIPVAIGVAVGILLLGGIMFWRSRTVYLDLEFPVHRRWEVLATLLAGAAIVFWGLFLLAAWLASKGVELL